MRRALITVLTMSLTAATGLRAETATEAWFDEPMPEGIRVVNTELDGPVFATADGRTIYEWPSHKLRNGYSGENPGIPACYDEVTTVTAGLMSPYPAGIVLPDLDQRPVCTDLWPPLVASDDDKTIGKWTVIERKDGTLQWAYDEQPLYTHARDAAAGDVLGGTTRRYSNDAPAYRVPIKPRPLLPPGFAVRSMEYGRLLTTGKNESIYAYTDDTAEQTQCHAACTERWQPVLAPALARPLGEWDLLERSPGVRQWVYRGKPLYTHVRDQRSWSQEGSDEPGWQNVYTQNAPPFPESFTVQSTLSGLVLADPDGRTLYVYRCGDDSIDQLSCDHPGDTQAYRLAMCGGTADKCNETWRYVNASPDAQSTSRSWQIVLIDPGTGRFAEPEDDGALRVWAYRDRPIYTYAGDTRPGDVHGDGTGEWRGQRNGLKAIWLRDDLMGRDQ